VATSHVQPVVAGWLELFSDQRLEALVQEALADNFDIMAQTARLDQAAALVSTAASDQSPKLAANVGTSRRRSALRVTDPTGTESVQTSTDNAYQLTLDASWEIDVWGRLRDQHSAALADAQAASAQLQWARLSLAAQVAQAYWDALASAEQLRLAERTLQSFREAESVLDGRYDSGVSSSLDLRLARAQTETAAAALQQRARQRDQQLRVLETLLGRYPEASVELLGPEPVLPAIAAAIPAGLPSDLLARRPDVLQAERQVAAAGVRIEVARKAFLPRLSLTASAGRQSDELGDLLESSFSVWSIAGNLVAPLFQGRALTANLELARAQATEALARYGQAALNAFSEVEGALATESYLSTQLRHQSRASEEATAAETLAWEQYTRGLSDIVTVLEAQRRAVDNRQAVIETQRLLLVNRVALHLALGGDFGTEAAPPAVTVRTPLHTTTYPVTGTEPIQRQLDTANLSP
jgi:NodT family efflux transporter outer membrane factor (OMF) lipoprotein